MDDNEVQEYLIEISDRTARIDERTEGIREDIDELRDEDVKQSDRIDEIEVTVNRHGYILGTVGFVVTSTVAGIIGAVTKVFKI